MEPEVNLPLVQIGGDADVARRSSADEAPE
jgi:hypothetical protein